MTVNDHEHNPDLVCHAMRHIDDAQEWRDRQTTNGVLNYTEDTALIDALVGIGLALLAIARKR